MVVITKDVHVRSVGKEKIFHAPSDVEGSFKMQYDTETGIIKYIPLVPVTDPEE